MKTETAKSRQKRTTRTRILQSAGLLIRRHGLDGPSVANVMKGAGLTVGGFYAHFRTRDAMVAEALLGAVDENLDKLFSRADSGSDQADSSTAIASYLSSTHRDNVDSGCPLPAALGGASAAAPKVRAAVGLALERFASRLRDRNDQRRGLNKSDALAIVAILAGGVAVSRALKDAAASNQVLAACHKRAARMLRE